MTQLPARSAYVALVTCFNEDEAINFEATRAQVRRQVAAGNNIMCCGTNGDFSALTHGEKLALTEAVVDEVAGRVKIIVNAGCPATFETLQLARGMVSYCNWRMVRAGKEAYSRDMEWVVYHAGGSQYRRRKVSPTW